MARPSGPIFLGPLEPCGHHPYEHTLSAELLVEQMRREAKRDPTVGFDLHCFSKDEADKVRSLLTREELAKVRKFTWIAR